MNMLYRSIINTPLGEMVIYATDHGIVVFTNRERKDFDIFLKNALLQYKEGCLDIDNSHITLLKKEVKEYFNGTLKKFSVPTTPVGTEFQKRAWDILKQIPYGQTISYIKQAEMLSEKRYARAVGGANAKNPIEIIIPCHRVISKSGSLRGFASGIERKQWLISHEQCSIL